MDRWSTSDVENISAVTVHLADMLVGIFADLAHLLKMGICSGECGFAGSTAQAS